ncbi:hypothetical protein IAU59_001227 [Kwoniella sp. CBS 9459]
MSLSPIKSTHRIHPPPISPGEAPESGAGAGAGGAGTVVEVGGGGGGYIPAHPTDEEMFKRRYVAIQELIHELEDENNLIAYRIAKHKRQQREEADRQAAKALAQAQAEAAAEAKAEAEAEAARRKELDIQLRREREHAKSQALDAESKGEAGRHDGQRGDDDGDDNDELDVMSQPVDYVEERSAGGRAEISQEDDELEEEEEEDHTRNGGALSGGRLRSRSRSQSLTASDRPRTVVEPEPVDKGKELRPWGSLRSPSPPRLVPEPPLTHDYYGRPLAPLPVLPKRSGNWQHGMSRSPPPSDIKYVYESGNVTTPPRGRGRSHSDDEDEDELALAPIHAGSGDDDGPEGSRQGGAGTDDGGDGDDNGDDDEVGDGDGDVSMEDDY